MSFLFASEQSIQITPLNIFINIIIGLIVAGGTLIITGIYRHIIINVSPKIRRVKHFCGYYATYHLNTNGDGNIIISSLKLRINIWGNFSASLFTRGYKYKGKAELLDTNLYMNFNGIGHDEKMLWIFNEPLSEQFLNMSGIIAAIREQRLPVACKVYIRKIDKPVRPQKVEFIRISPDIRNFLSTSNVILTADNLEIEDLNEK